MMLRTDDYRPVKLPLTQIRKLHFEHWRTQWSTPARNEAIDTVCDLLGRGISTWKISTHNASAWLNWDWVVLDNGIIAMSNPFDIRSNAVLLGENDRHIPLHDASAILMSVIHDLPWRDEVESLMALRPAMIH